VRGIRPLIATLSAGGKVAIPTKAEALNKIASADAMELKRGINIQTGR